MKQWCSGVVVQLNLIRIFDRIFDIMNSRSPFGKGYKSALSLKNYNYWKAIFIETSDYIKQLKINGCNILQHARKTFALGFLINIYSFEKLALLLLTRPENPQTYFLTYKCSQDHLQLYFGCIRSRGGWNNNPNALQFKWALRKLLFRNSVQPSVNGNCCINYNSDLAPVFDFENSRRSENQDSDDALEDDLNYLAATIDSTALSSFQDNVFYYIGGVITRKIFKKNSCNYCQEMIVEEQHTDHNYSVDIKNCRSFTKFISSGKLYFPSSNIFQIVSYTERAFRAEVSIGYLGKYNFKKRIILSVVQYFISKLHTLFKIKHPVEDINNELHEIQMIKFVASTYADIRIQTHAKKDHCNF